MMIILAIVSGILAAELAYRVLFYDFNDFMNGCDRFLSLIVWRRVREISLPPPNILKMRVGPAEFDLCCFWCCQLAAVSGFT